MAIGKRPIGTTRRIAAAATASKRARDQILQSRRNLAMSRGLYGGVRSGELKTIDIDPAEYVADTTGTVTLLNGVATGTDFTDRIGRKIMMKSIYIQGFCYPVDTTTADTLARLIVVYDTQPNGAAPTIANVLKTANSISQTNLDNRDRFRIIYDKRFAIPTINNTATQTYSYGANKVVKLYRKCNLETQFNNTGATITAITTGSLYMITIGNQTANAGGKFALSTRIRFVDT